MTTINTTSGSGVSTQHTTQSGSDAGGSDGTLHARKADGLPGQLGLFEVTVSGETRYVTADELAHLQGGGGANGGAGGGPGASGQPAGTPRDAASGFAVFRHGLADG